MALPANSLPPPELHRSTGRLAAMDLATVAAFVEDRADMLWMREACSRWSSADPGVELKRLGVYGLANTRGVVVPTLLVLVERKTPTPRSAVAGAYYAGGTLTLTRWPTNPGRVPTVRGGRLAP